MFIIIIITVVITIIIMLFANGSWTVCDVCDWFVTVSCSWTLLERRSWTVCRVCEWGCSWTMFRSPLVVRVVVHMFSSREIIGMGGGLGAGKHADPFQFCGLGIEPQVVTHFLRRRRTLVSGEFPPKPTLVSNGELHADEWGTEKTGDGENVCNARCKFPRRSHNSNLRRHDYHTLRSQTMKPSNYQTIKLWGTTIYIYIYVLLRV